MKRYWLLLILLALIITACRQGTLEPTSVVTDTSLEQSKTTQTEPSPAQEQSEEDVEQVTENEIVWSGEILIDEFVLIPEDVTLIIEPGTIVKFKHYRGYKNPDARMGMEIWGTILAEGTPDEPIYFTSDADDPQNGDWGMIRVIGSDESFFNYVVVEFGQQGLNFWGGKPLIHNSVVRWNNWEGLYFESYAEAEIYNTHIYQNGYNGIAAEQFNHLVIERCLIEKNGTHGVHIDASSAVVIQSHLLNNGAAGISVDNSGSLKVLGSCSSENGEGVAVGEGDNILELGDVDISGNEGCQVCGNNDSISDEMEIPDQLAPPFAPDMSYALGYIPGDQALDRYHYVYDSIDETREVVNKIGDDLGLTWAIAWDGEAVWTATLWAEYYRLDPVTGEILQQFHGPGSQVWGLTYDGQHLWALDFAERMIFEIDPTTGATLSQFPSPDPDNGCKGLTWDGEYLYVAGWATGLVYIVDCEGNQVGTIAKTEWGIGGLGWDGEYFWSPGGPGIVKANKEGEQVGWIYPASEGTWDIAWGDGVLWATQRTNENWPDAKIYAIKILDDHHE